MARAKNTNIIFSKIEKVAGKLPVIFFGIFTFVGILVVGILIGYMIASSEKSTTSQKYFQLIIAYSQLERLYESQSNYLDIAMDRTILATDPQRTFEAFDALRILRDQINVQLGKLSQLKEAAEIPANTSGYQY